MATHELDSNAHLPEWPTRRDVGIGVVGAGFIVRDCHLVAYAEAGFRVVGITSRTLERGTGGRRAAGHPAGLSTSVEAMLDDPEVEVVDVAVPPAEQPGVIRRILDASAARSAASWRRSRWRCRWPKRASLVEACARAGVVLQVNQNMRYDQSVRALKTLLDRGELGEPVLATIEMRAIPHWMPWARDGRSLSTFIMSIHHLDTFRYWLGDPTRVLASTRPDPRTEFPHDDGINLYILEYDDGRRASAWDDVWAGPCARGRGAEIGIRWRFEGTEGLALGTIGWPGWPERVPSTLDYSTTATTGRLASARGGPRPGSPTPSPARWRGLLRALETGTEPDISGRDNLGTIALCEAVLAAAREHRVVQLGRVQAIMEATTMLDRLVSRRSIDARPDAFSDSTVPHRRSPFDLLVALAASWRPLGSSRSRLVVVP